MLAAYSESLPLSQVDEYAETLIAQRLSTVSGVAQVDVFGAQKFAVRVKVDPRELAARGIGLDDVENAIREANSNEATGELDAGAKSRTIKTTGRLRRAEDFRGAHCLLPAAFPSGSSRLLRSSTALRTTSSRLVQQYSRHRSGNSATTGSQHRSGDRSHSRTATDLQGAASRSDQTRYPL